MASPVASYRLGQLEMRNESMLTFILVALVLILFQAYKFLIGDSNIIRAVMGTIVLMLMTASYLLSKHDSEHAISNNLYFLCNITAMTFMYTVNGMYFSPTLGWLIIFPLNLLIVIGSKHAKFVAFYSMSLLLVPLLLQYIDVLDPSMLFTPAQDVIVVNVILMTFCIGLLFRWLTLAINDPVNFLNSMEKRQKEIDIAKQQQLNRLSEDLHDHIDAIESNLKILENRLPSNETNLQRARLKTIEMRAILNQAETDLPNKDL